MQLSLARCCCLGRAIAAALLRARWVQDEHGAVRLRNSIFDNERAMASNLCRVSWQRALAKFVWVQMPPSTEICAGRPALLLHQAKANIHLGSVRDEGLLLGTST